ncbi:hypothetical protein B0H10DRAFT_2091230 [Mycena sp. CBHHK59/15]|nr:hypothetical protein B0H10DRAFT_2092531 [Mycena sp. CBHHK59/15]KAJ6591313.1 hypothetical protein B0H10DRAFT_2091230 [Mycena sp. CBHHK59/15]
MIVTPKSARSGREETRAQVLCFRSYLRVSNEKYRRALTHVLLSRHGYRRMSRNYHEFHYRR